MPLAKGEPIEYNAVPLEMRRYLHDDLWVECSSVEYKNIRSTALVLLAIWPVGVPVLRPSCQTHAPDLHCADRSRVKPTHRASAEELHHPCQTHAPSLHGRAVK